VAGISRDQGLKRVSRITRWIGVAGIATAGVFAAIAAKVQPGRGTVVTPAVGGLAPSAGNDQSGGSPLSSVPASGDQIDGGLQAPAQAPQATRGRAAAVSGGS
jgi:hypothetical protein